MIVAAGEARLVGSEDADPRIDAALEHGRAYAGRESDGTKDRKNFEFVVPVNLSGGRYAYEVTYDHRTYDAQLHDMRMVLLLVGLLALFGGGAVFYVVGGRALMRDHRRALQRATRDGLTDLPNQRAFQDKLPQAVASSARYQDPLALVVLDVDDFKFINDHHGHPHGDSVLRHVAEVLREARPGDRPYRTGGDEFALLLAHTDSDGARTLARRLSRSFTEAGIEVSVGSALRSGGLESPAAGWESRAAGRADTLRAEADAALYEAKRQGGHRSAHFDDIRERVVVTSTAKKEAVRALIDEGGLTTVFQPIWDFAAETLLGVEALMRPDPAHGLSGSAEAFDVAEQLGRVHQLDVSACRALCVLYRSAGTACCCSSTSRPTRSTSIPRAMTGSAWRCRAGLSPSQVVIEVTSVSVDAPRLLSSACSGCADRGFRSHWTTSARAIRAWRCCARSRPSSSSSIPRS